MTAPAPVISLAAARVRLAKCPSKMRVQIEKDGGLTLRLPGTPAYTIEPDRAIEVLQWLVGELQRRKYERLGVLQKERPEPVHTPRCRRTRDGGIGVERTGCRRLKDHDGACKDARGSFTPATCLHVGRGTTTITIAATDTSFKVCRHCLATLTPKQVAGAERVLPPRPTLPFVPVPAHPVRCAAAPEAP